jgi:hypothetical protein
MHVTLFLGGGRKWFLGSKLVKPKFYNPLQDNQIAEFSLPDLKNIQLQILQRQSFHGKSIWFYSQKLLTVTSPISELNSEPLVYKSRVITTELMRQLSTIVFLSVCILLVKLSWTTKRVIVKEGNTTISHYEIWSLESTKWRWGSLACISV